MSEFKIAYRYAKSLADLAQEKNILDDIANDMELFLEVCKVEREVETMLRKPIVGPMQKLRILNALFTGKVNEVTLSFFRILSKKNRERYLPGIAREYLRQWKQIKGIQEADLVTPFELTKELEEAFLKMLTESTGKKIILNKKVDPQLIGGFLLRVGDRQMDESLKAKLARVHRSLNQKMSSTQII